MMRPREQGERAEPTRSVHAGVILVAGLLAGVLPAIFPLAPGYGASDTPAVVLAAGLAAGAAIVLIPLTFMAARPCSIEDSSTQEGRWS
jgi:hypothetical protein